MATLILTAVGSLVGGPVGGAIGALIGQRIDSEIFKPKGREGPRLSDLKVQLSHYGAQIPQIFGTMRVSGNVIWATDLIERRARRSGGKGQPSVTEFSYSASLAIALSSRPILGIGRIWADGNLLRGTGGNFNERTIFRLHNGDQDQEVDPLIASALGPENTSAFRGIAYAVFEDLELAAFGNRIPSLTFEVQSDLATITSLDVVQTLINPALDSSAPSAPGDSIRPGAPLDSGDSSAPSAPKCLEMRGYAASGTRVRDAIEPLVEVDHLRVISTNGAPVIARAGALGSTRQLDSYRARGSTAAQRIVQRRRIALSSLPATILLRHYEPERDYQIGQQNALVPGGGAREQLVDLPAVISAGAARSQAHQLAVAASDGREKISISADFSAAALPVGGLVSGENLDGEWRIVQRNITEDSILLDLVSYRPLSIAPAAMTAAPGVAILSPDHGAQEGRVTIFDLPPLGEAAHSTPQRLIANAGEGQGWRGVDLWLIAGAGQEPLALGASRPATALGRLEAPLAAGATLLLDKANTALVRLSNDTAELISVDDAALFAGANRAMIGDEIIQFGHAEKTAPALWRLSRLIRGQQDLPRQQSGQNNHLTHTAGTDFVLLDDPAHFLIPELLDQPASAPNAVVEWAPRGSFELAQLAIPNHRRAIRPLSPVHGKALQNSDNSLTLHWIRRSRLGWAWRDEVDTPIGESRLLFRISVPLASGDEQTFETSALSLRIPADLRTRLREDTAIMIRQIGDHAASEPLFIATN